MANQNLAEAKEKQAELNRQKQHELEIIEKRKEEEK